MLKVLNQNNFTVASNHQQNVSTYTSFKFSISIETELAIGLYLLQTHNTQLRFIIASRDALFG